MLIEKKVLVLQNILMIFFSSKNSIHEKFLPFSLRAIFYLHKINCSGNSCQLQINNMTFVAFCFTNQSSARIIKTNMNTCKNECGGNSYARWIRINSDVVRIAIM